MQYLRKPPAYLGTVLEMHKHFSFLQVKIFDWHYFTNKGPSNQSYGFSSSHVWMWELDYKESWAQRIDAFELWCWRRLLRVPWTARRSNQSILEEISPGCSLEGLVFCHLLWRTDSLEKTLMLGEIESRRRRGWQRMRSLDGITDSMDMSLSKLQELGSQVCRSPWGRRESDTTEWLNWTDYNRFSISRYFITKCIHSLDKNIQWL